MLREIGIKFKKQVEKITYPDNLGKRSKFGGKPDWIQEEKKVKCIECGCTMEFVSQIDSIDYTGDLNPNAEYMFGDVGMIYIFFCFQCHIPHAIFQSY